MASGDVRGEVIERAAVCRRQMAFWRQVHRGYSSRIDQITSSLTGSSPWSTTSWYAWSDRNSATVQRTAVVRGVNAFEQASQLSWPHPHTGNSALKSGVVTSRVSLLCFGLRGWNAVVRQVVPLLDKDGCCAIAEKVACQVGRAGS